MAHGRGLTDDELLVYLQNMSPTNSGDEGASDLEDDAASDIEYTPQCIDKNVSDDSSSDPGNDSIVGEEEEPQSHVPEMRPPRKYFYINCILSFIVQTCNEHWLFA